MKYILLMYAEEGAWPPEEYGVALQESIQICHRLHAKGQYLGASPLQPPSTAKCVRVRDGKRAVSDGPFAETKEQLGGYFLIDADNLDEAIAIAASIPGTTRGTAEITPPAGGSGTAVNNSPRVLAPNQISRIAAKQVTMHLSVQSGRDLIILPLRLPPPPSPPPVTPSAPSTPFLRKGV